MELKDRKIYYPFQGKLLQFDTNILSVFFSFPFFFLNRKYSNREITEQISQAIVIQPSCGCLVGAESESRTGQSQ